MNAVINEKLPTSLHQADRYTNFPRFQGAQRDHVRVQSSSCCFCVIEFCSPQGVIEFIINQETYLSWEV